MSRIPYLQRQARAFEAALAGSAAAPVRRRGWAIAVAAFLIVLVAGGVWLAMRPFSGSDAPVDTTATTVGVTSTLPVTTEGSSTSEPAPEPAVTLPTSWGRVPSQPALAGTGRVTLSAVTAWREGLLAVGSDISMDWTSDGVVLSSPDGVVWDEAARLEGISLADVAAGPLGLVAVGLAGPDDPETGLPAAVAAASRDGGSWNVVPLPVGDGAGFVQAHAVVAWDGGFVVGGSEVEVGAATDPSRARAALWSSADGTSWERVWVSGWAVEATVEGVAAADGFLVAVGLVSEEEGKSRPAVWTSADGREWRERDVEYDSLFGFTGVTGVAVGEDGLVAVGFAPASGGTTGAVWTSGDGTAWQPVADPDGVLLGRTNAATRIHDVIAVDGGYVAVGATLERPFRRYRIWTSGDGRVWQRFDLADLGPEWPTTAAFDVTAAAGGVVVVGSLADLDGTAGEAAVWLGPPPGSVPASGSPEPVDEPPAAGAATITIDPPVAVAATRLRVRGSLRDSGSGGSVVVWLVPDDGSPLPLCEAAVVGSGFSCRVVLGDVGVVPAGGYGLALGEAEAMVVEGAALEVLPEGSTVVTLSAVYQATLWPMLQSVTVLNHGADPLDVTGWSLADSGAFGESFVFPAGTAIDPGSSFLLDFAGPGGGVCPEATGRYLHWCRVVGTGSRIDFGDGDLLWRGGDIELRDADGTLVAVWPVPR